MALKDKGGKIEFPQTEGDALFEAIVAARAGEIPDTRPYIGSLPNRFKADISKVSGDAGEICKQAVTDAWMNLADEVFKTFIESNSAPDTEEIWQQQVKNFWEINWVSGQAPADNSDGTWLDKRKNWRSHYVGPGTDEGGDHCRLMGQYQEISGYHRFGEAKRKQTEFWDNLRNSKGMRDLDLKDDERLCAIALIKRLFPVLGDEKIKSVIGWVPGTTKGKEKVNIINWPSTSYICAVPWLKAVEPNPPETERGTYSSIVKSSLKSSFMGETETELFNFPKEEFFKLDGHLLHQDGIAAWDEKEFKTSKEAAETRKQLSSGLADVAKKVGGSTAIYASEFYAVLAMDGDEVGARMKFDAELISESLAIFTNSVKEYFDPNCGNPPNGVLIYAGGDDVLALVPVDSAVLAAKYLRKKYEESFCEKVEEPFTMSASITFAQYKIPLTAVLANAHFYLDEIAKAKNGRDSVAIAVMKPGGIACDWTSCWKDKDCDPVSALEEIAMEGLGQSSLGADDDYSSSFFYNIRERYLPLFADQEMDDGDEHHEPDVEADFADPQFMKNVLEAEYLKSLGQTKVEREKVELVIGRMMKIGQPLYRKNKEINKSGIYNFDGALVARFMAVEARWHMLKIPVSGAGNE